MNWLLWTETQAVNHSAVVSPARDGLSLAQDASRTQRKKKWCFFSKKVSYKLSSELMGESGEARCKHKDIRTELNVFVPWTSTCWNPFPQRDSIWRWSSLEGHWDSMGSRGWRLQDGISALIIRDIRELAPSLPWEEKVRNAPSSSQEERIHQELNPARTLIVNSLTSRTTRKLIPAV